ncbi:MAG: rod shape-determining protein MreD [Candidatus Omnitrophica bacterium]|jgi:rod shape-determining protein MreD|nr:rod shape-determining protein MreD [Candidatus Omnitrophota bacterium]MDD5078808.1 rod shape-determining protein MreD [Candidatus Omnitrophota bacterium]
MRNLRFSLLILGLAFIQVGISEPLRLFGVKPDLLLISVVVAGIYFEFGWALFFSLFAGILKDVFTAGSFGMSSLFFPVVAFLIIQLNKRLTIENNTSCSVVVFLSSIVYDGLVRLLSVYMNDLVSYPVFFRVSILGALYTSIVMFVLLRPIKKIIRRL